MRNILDKIILEKKKHINQLKKIIDIKSLEQSEYFEIETYSLKNKIIKENSFGIISEFKRKSPSKPNINLNADAVTITKGYQNAKSSGISILTDELFFGGSNKDFVSSRKELSIPMLRKDFIIDEFQLIESKSIGADVILLMASCLNNKEILKFSKLAKSLSLEVLLEVHSEEELNYSLNSYVDIVGVNNRNLNNFTTDINNSIKLSSFIPKDFCKISESGIFNKEDIIKLKSYGFNGFLIGENFMKTNDPSYACLNFIKSLYE